MNPPPKDRDRAIIPQSYFLSDQVEILHHFADTTNDSDAIFLLAEMNFHGNFSYPRNFTQAFERYHQLASLTGNSTAQSILGFIYATGIGGAVEPDQAKALLYHTFAAEQGSIRSEMTVAYRHHAGIGTGRNCDKAVHYYKKVAEKALEYFRSAPPGGRYMVRQAHSWADESGGVYGEGASVSSSGRNANQDKNAHASTEDIMEYLDLLSRKGDLKASYSLAKMYYDGSRVTKRNIRKSQRLFMKIARQHWDKTGKVISGGPHGIEKIAGKAAAHIGRMFLRGEGWDQSYEKAATWFRRGIANGDGLCQYLMGLMYRDGLGVPQDSFKAASYFKVAADADISTAQAALGILFLDQGELETAGRYFEIAAGHGYIEAIYYLAELTNKGIGRERHCSVATAYYKVVSEAVEELHSLFQEANEAYENGQLDTAMITSLMAAEQGYEVAQSNAAYLLDESRSLLELPVIPGISAAPKRASPSLLNSSLALMSWTRSARQSNVDSLVKMGDYYLSGLGAASPSSEKASTCYHTAAESHSSAQALWNLGWMHENGIAVEQDFHMAKRYYDLALEMNSEAYLPVKLALTKLRARSFWNTLTRGKINSIQPDPPPSTPKQKSRTIREWITTFLENDNDDYETSEPEILEEGGDLAVDPNTPLPPSPQDDGFYEDLDDGVFETLVIVGLAATLALLVYYRQQRQLHQRQMANGNGNANQDPVPPPPPAPGQAPVPAPTSAVGENELSSSGSSEQQARDRAGGGGQDGRDEGLFPPPGDPEHAAWAAGGVGH